MKKTTTIKKQVLAKVFGSCHFSKGDGWPRTIAEK